MALCEPLISVGRTSDTRVRVVTRGNMFYTLLMLLLFFFMFCLRMYVVLKENLVLTLCYLQHDVVLHSNPLQAGA